MAEIGIAPHIVEACLNHVSGAKAGVAGTYNRAAYAAGKEGGAGAVGGSCRGPRDRSQGEGRAAARERVVSKLPPWTGNDAAMQRWLDDKLDELLKEDGAKARSRRKLPLSQEEKQALFPEDSDEGAIAAAERGDIEPAAEETSEVRAISSSA